MYQAANVQFDRIVDEFMRWRAVSEDERSPAPAWWWGPAFELLGVQSTLPDEIRTKLELPDGASYADGAQIFFKSLAGQTSLPWPDDFPRRPRYSDPA